VVVHTSGFLIFPSKPLHCLDVCVWGVHLLFNSFICICLGGNFVFFVLSRVTNNDLSVHKHASLLRWLVTCSFCIRSRFVPFSLFWNPLSFFCWFHSRSVWVHSATPPQLPDCGKQHVGGGGVPPQPHPTYPILEKSRQVRWGCCRPCLPHWTYKMQIWFQVCISIPN